MTDIRPILIVILSENRKGELLKDIGEFFNQTAQKWYSGYGIPY